VGGLLADNGILFIGSARCETPGAGRVSVSPGGRELEVDRVVALPELFGPSVPGVPLAAANGFIPIDAHCRVLRLDGVFAAGDATEFAVKQGGVAAQQADTAAEAIAALAGAPVDPRPFDPVVHGVLLGGPKPLYLSAHVTGGRGSSSEVSDAPSWPTGAKIAARYLAPFLDARDRARGDDRDA
jgi:sulfide:quinone oxidoreductase